MCLFALSHYHVCIVERQEGLNPHLLIQTRNLFSISCCACQILKQILEGGEGGSSATERFCTGCNLVVLIHVAWMLNVCCDRVVIFMSFFFFRKEIRPFCFFSGEVTTFYPNRRHRHNHPDPPPPSPFAHQLPCVHVLSFHIFVSCSPLCVTL